METMNSTPNYLTKEFIEELFNIQDPFERECKFIEIEQQAKADGNANKFKRLVRAYKTSSNDDETPDYIENGIVNENKYINFLKDGYAYVKNSDIICVNDIFYTSNGIMSYEDLKALIYETLGKHLKNKIAYQIESVINLMKIECSKPVLDVKSNVIYFKNGDYFVDTKLFSEHKSICKYRLPVEYNPSADTPTKFLKYINDLLEEDDVKTIQQYLGYCFVPVTKAQTMLSIIGAGGEGKSVLGNICMSLFGESAIKGSIHQIENDKFFKANLVNKLIFIDDDVSFDAFKTTNNLKSIITADTSFTVEQKYKQAYDAKIFSRLLVFGNASLSTLYDKSDGFFRRQIILKTKPKDKARINNPNLYQELIEELPGITKWCLEGLDELIKNNFKLYKSKKTIKNEKENIENNCNIISFLKDDSYIVFDKEKQEHTADLYAEYMYWCQTNAEDYLKSKTFVSYLKENQFKYNIEYTENCVSKGKRARGFKGVKIVQKRNY